MGPSAAAFAGSPAPDPAYVAAPAAEWSLIVDNDDFNFWQPPADRPDFGYTHGTELDASLSRAPKWLARHTPAWLDGGTQSGPARLELRAAQRVYSPWRLPADRPYAGWLELACGLRHAAAGSNREAILHVGVTGPASRAAAIQRWIHRHFDHGALPDWSHQLPQELGIGIETSGARRTWRSGGSSRFAAAAGPEWRARLGTYAVDLRAGLQTVAGWNAPDVWGDPTTRSGPAFYAMLAGRTDLIVRDEFLEGTWSRPSPGVSATPIPLVPELETGIGLGVGSARLEWRIHRRAKEFRHQPELHTYSTLALSWR